jgi:hypothetical protein
MHIILLPVCAAAMAIKIVVWGQWLKLCFELSSFIIIIIIIIVVVVVVVVVGRGSSVSIVTRYRLNSPGIESQ